MCIAIKANEIAVYEFECPVPRMGKLHGGIREGVAVEIEIDVEVGYEVVILDALDI